MRKKEKRIKMWKLQYSLLLYNAQNELEKISCVICVSSCGFAYYCRSYGPMQGCKALILLTDIFVLEENKQIQESCWYWLSLPCIFTQWNLSLAHHAQGSPGFGQGLDSTWVAGMCDRTRVHPSRALQPHLPLSMLPAWAPPSQCWVSASVPCVKFHGISCPYHVPYWWKQEARQSNQGEQQTATQRSVQTFDTQWRAGAVQNKHVVHHNEIL